MHEPIPGWSLDKQASVMSTPSVRPTRTRLPGSSSAARPAAREPGALARGGEIPLDLGSCPRRATAAFLSAYSARDAYLEGAAGVL